MYARVARFEGADAAALEDTATRIRSEAEAAGGPPEGVPAQSFLLLHDKAGGKVLAITLFESEDDYRQGDATLNSMSPPGAGMGQRAAVEKYEVAFEVEA